MIAHINRRGHPERPRPLVHRQAIGATIAMTADIHRTEPLGVTYDDLQIVAAIAASRFAPGAGEADRVAHVRKLLDVAADLHYAISTYMHRVLMFAGRRPMNGDLADETDALQDSLDAFAFRVREIADRYRPLGPTPTGRSDGAA